MEEFFNDKSLNSSLHKQKMSSNDIHLRPQNPQNFQGNLLPISPNNINIDIGHQYDQFRAPNTDSSLNPCYSFQPNINTHMANNNSFSNKASTCSYNSTTINGTDNNSLNNNPQNPISPPFSFPNLNHSLMSFNSETLVTSSSLTSHISNVPMCTYPLNYYQGESSTVKYKSKREMRLMKSREAADRARTKKRERLKWMENAIARGTEEIEILSKDIEKVKMQLKPYQDRHELLNKQRPIKRSRSL